MYRKAVKSCFLFAALFLIIAFCFSCAQIEKGVQTGMMGVLETALSPLEMMTTGQAFPETRATYQISVANKRIKKWNDIKNSTDFQTQFKFIDDNESDFSIEWVPKKYIIDDNQKQLVDAKRRYSRFLQEITPTLEFKKLYENVMQNKKKHTMTSLLHFYENQVKHPSKAMITAMNAPLVKALREEVEFESAKNIDTVQHYDQYRKEYPNSKYVAEIETLREQALLNEAKRKNSVQLFNQYISEYPSGKFIREVKRLKEKAMFASAKSKNKVSGYDQYIKHYPSGKYLAETKRLRERACFDQAKKSENYDFYLDQYPEGDYSDQAKSMKELAFFEKAKSTESMDFCERYLATYPDGKYLNEIKELMNYIKEKEFYLNAKRNNTISSYNKYLKQYPRGRYVSRVKEHQKAIKEEQEKERLQARKRAEEKRKREAERKRRLANLKNKGEYVSWNEKVSFEIECIQVFMARSCRKVDYNFSFRGRVIGVDKQREEYDVKLTRRSIIDPSAVSISYIQNKSEAQRWANNLHTRSVDFDDAR